MLIGIYRIRTTGGSSISDEKSSNKFFIDTDNYKSYFGDADEYSEEWVDRMRRVVVGLLKELGYPDDVDFDYAEVVECYPTGELVFSKDPSKPFCGERIKGNEPSCIESKSPCGNPPLMSVRKSIDAIYRDIGPAVSAKIGRASCRERV